MLHFRQKTNEKYRKNKIKLKFLSTETLRKYPLAAVVRRMTTEPYVLPDGGSATLEPGTLTVVPVHAFHHDFAHFAAPETFQPNRFPGELESPAYMPYGTGPQSYIGKRSRVVFQAVFPRGMSWTYLFILHIMTSAILPQLTVLSTRHKILNK